MDEKKITITVKQINRITTILGNRGDSLYTILCDNDLFVDAVCAGRGTCGQCGIQLIEGDLPVSTQDEEVFSKQELRDGYRLSCQAYPEDDCVIYLREKETYQTDYDKKNQNIIENEQNLIQTGDTVEVGSKTWTFGARGDTDGDGTVGVNDLAKVKLHFIEKDLLYGAYLKAAETDDSESISTNDIARIKLYIIETFIQRI